MTRLELLTSDDPEVIWAAGFMEGEAYFSIDKRGRWRLGVAQVNPEPLERLTSIFEVGRIYSRAGGGNDGFARRPWWGWEVSDRVQILRVTNLVLPWLTSNRQERIPWREEAMRYGTAVT